MYISSVGSDLDGSAPLIKENSCNLQSKRQKILHNTRQNITRLLEELELSPNTSFERDVVCDAEVVSLTNDNLRAIKRYNDEVCVLDGF
jgi:hypothetical protein